MPNGVAARWARPGATPSARARAATRSSRRYRGRVTPAEDGTRVAKTRQGDHPGAARLHRRGDDIDRRRDQSHPLHACRLLPRRGKRDQGPGKARESNAGSDVTVHRRACNRKPGPPSASARDVTVWAGRLWSPTPMSSQRARPAYLLTYPPMSRKICVITGLILAAV